MALDDVVSTNGQRAPGLAILQAYRRACERERKATLAYRIVDDLYGMAWMSGLVGTVSGFVHRDTTTAVVGGACLVAGTLYAIGNGIVSTLRAYVCASLDYQRNGRFTLMDTNYPSKDRPVT